MPFNQAAGRKEKQRREGNYRLPALRLCGGVTGPSFCRRGHLPCCCDNRSLHIAEMLSAAGFNPDANGRKWAPTATKLITYFSSASIISFYSPLNPPSNTTSSFSFFSWLFLHSTLSYLRWTLDSFKGKCREDLSYYS